MDRKEERWKGIEFLEVISSEVFGNLNVGEGCLCNCTTEI